MEQAISVILICINLAVFFLYGEDKRRSIRGEWRISERNLLLAAFCFGSLGAFLGMKHYHHKTKHWKFRILVPGMLLIQVVILAGLFLMGRLY